MTPILHSYCYFVSVFRSFSVTDWQLAGTTTADAAAVKLHW